MSNSRSFLSNALVYGFGAMAMQVASAVLLPLYTHYLSPADYGTLDILQRTGDVLVLLILGRGIQVATFSFYCQAKTPDARQHAFSAVAVVLWSLLTFGGLAAVVLSPLLASWLGIGSPALVTLGIAVVLLEGAVSLPLALMQARVDSFGFVTVNLLMAITRLTLIIVGVAVLGLGVWGVLGGTVICLGIFGISLTMREVARGFPRPSRTTAHNVLLFALPLLPTGLLGIGLSSADRFFLISYDGTAELGVYSLGYKLADVIPLLATMPLFKVWTAILYEVFGRPDATRAVGRYILRMVAVRVFIGLGVCLFSAELVTLVAPAEYRAAAYIIPLITVSSTLHFTSNLFEGSFWAKRQTKWKPFIMALSCVVAVLSFSILVPRFGSVGAAVSLAIAFTVHACVTFVVTQRVFFVAYDWRAVIIGTAAAVGLYGAAQLFVATGAAGILLKAGLWISWPALLWQLGVVDGDEEAWVRRQLAWSWRMAHRYLPALSR